MKKIISILFILTFSAFTFAQEIRLPLTEIVQKADLIIKGKVIETQCKWVENELGRHIHTFAVVQIDEIIKGYYAAGLIELSVIGGKVDDVTEYVTHSFSYEKEEELILFLDSKTKYPIGGTQGKFTIYNNKVYFENKELYIDDFQNKIIKYLINPSEGLIFYKADLPELQVDSNSLKQDKNLQQLQIDPNSLKLDKNLQQLQIDPNSLKQDKNLQQLQIDPNSLKQDKNLQQLQIDPNSLKQDKKPNQESQQLQIFRDPKISDGGAK